MIRTSEKIGLAAVLIIAVCVIVAATHRPSLEAKAISFDDQQYLIRNVLVQNPGWTSAKRFLTEVLAPSTVRGYYQPLAMISLMLDYAAGGRENNLRPFHITSLAFHTANTALIIVLLYGLFGNIWAAAAAGLLFGVHPMTVEPIPWVGERKTLLAAFFALWSLILYLRYSRGGGWKSYAGCFVMYLLALMSKPTSVPLPAVMLLMDYWPLRRLKIKSVFEKLPLFILGTIFAVITYVSQSQTAVAVLPARFGPEKVLLVLCHNIIFYPYKILVPINLSSHYAFPKPFGITQPMILAGVVGTCILIPILLVSLRWTRAALTGWLIFFAAIFPTMGVVGFTIVIASDKYAYLPSVGILMIATSFLIWVGRSKKIRIATVAAVLILAGAEAVAAQRYLRCWQSTIALCEHMLRLAPDSAPLYNDRGNIYSNKGEYDLAIADFNRALEINPKHAEAFNGRGTAYNDKGEYNPAISDFSKAIEVNPKLAEAYYNRANVYAKGKGRFDQAIADYNKAIEIKPEFVDAYANRGKAYRDKGQFDEAIGDYNKALAISPGSADIYNNRGSAYDAKGLLDNAIADYTKALEINPTYAEVWYNRGTVYYRKGEYDNAIRDYNKALEINPGYMEAYFNKATVCELAGRKTEAIESYKAFIRYAPPQYSPYVERVRQKIIELER